MRFFTLTTLVVFAAAGVALVFLQRQEEAFFAKVQQEQGRQFAQAQAELARRNEDAARRSLLAVHEAAHVNLTRLMSNLVWASDLAPLVAQAQRVSVEPCRALPPDPAADPQSQPRKACFAQVGQRIRALSGFETFDRKAYAAMHNTSVFKIKVFDLRGVTVYSSEHAQVGDDGAPNQGFRTALGGTPASELTHRARFSAFERVVENRDLISTYVPVRAGPDDRIVGVFELYSDVTPFLEQMQAASRAFAENIAANEAQRARTAAGQQQEVADSSNEFLVVVGGLLALLYVLSLAIVRVGQRFIDRQSLAQEQAARREQQWHREKMAALSAMAANVAHEVGNPLAVIAGVAETLPQAQHEPARQILEQTSRIARMMRKIADFASPRSGAPEAVDVNPLIEALCEFQAFDRRFRSKPIQFLPATDLPACTLVPDHLNEVMMNLLQACADVAEPAGRERGIRVATLATDGGGVCVELGCYSPASGEALPIGYVFADPRYEPARRRLADMGARVERVGDTLLRIVLP